MLEELVRRLEQRKNDGLFRYRLTRQSPQTPHVKIATQSNLSFASNDYLGLANHPEVAAALCRGTLQYGVGSGASHLISGHSEVHHELENALAKFVELPNALLFSTGYMANIAVVTTLVGHHDAVFADKLNHASLNDAALLSKAKLIRYPHLDLESLERALARTNAPNKLVLTDAVFSMDGDIAPIKALLTLCQKHGAWLLVDDAHGFGVLGRAGKGTLHRGLEPVDLNSPHLIYMATLGKAVGVFGAFVAGQPALIEMLIQFARTYGYTTAMPSALACAIMQSLVLLEQEEWRREKLARLIALLKDHYQSSRWSLLASATPIQPLLIRESSTAILLSELLRREGILVPAIRPPTVPMGQARLRISLSASHHEEEVIRLAETLQRAERTI